MNKDLKDYIDSFGMIVNKFDHDGGDSCAHGCAIIYSILLVDTLSASFKAMCLGIDPTFYVSKLDSKENPGRYCRHPDPNKWYSNPDTLSRDQLTPLLALIGLLKIKTRRWNLFKQHIKRLLLFAWNTRKNGQINPPWKVPDLCGPDIWGMWIRAFRFWPLYPVLLVSDFQTLIGSFIYRLKLSSNTIQMNHIIVVDYSNRIMPTPLSYLSKIVYGKEIPKAALQASWGPEWQAPVDTYLTKLVDSW